MRVWVSCVSFSVMSAEAFQKMDTVLAEPESSQTKDFGEAAELEPNILGDDRSKALFARKVKRKEICIICYLFNSY